MPAYVTMLLFGRFNRGSEGQKEVCWEAIPNPTIKLIFTLYVHCIPMTCSAQKGHHDRNISRGVLLYSGLHPIPSQHCTYQHSILHSITPRPILSSANLSRTHTLPYPILAHCRGSLLRNCLYTTQIRSPPDSYLPWIYISRVQREIV